MIFTDCQREWRPKENFTDSEGQTGLGNKQQPQRKQILLLLVRRQVSACAEELGVSPGNLISICKVAIPLLDAGVPRMLLISLEGGLQHMVASLSLALRCLKTLSLSYCAMAGCNDCQAEEIKMGSGLGLVLGSIETSCVGAQPILAHPACGRCMTGFQHHKHAYLSRPDKLARSYSAQANSSHPLSTRRPTAKEDSISCISFCRASRAALSASSGS